MAVPDRRSRRNPWSIRAALAIAVLASASYLLRKPASKPSPSDPRAPVSASAEVSPSPSPDLVRMEPGPESMRVAESPASSNPQATDDLASAPPPSVSGSLRGRVVDDTGTPVRTFVIDATRLTHRKPAALDPSAGLWRLFQETDGTFALDGLSPAEWELSARRPASIRSSAVVAAVPQRTEDLVLVLPRPAAIAGIVVAEDGNALSNARVYLWSAGESPPSLGDAAFGVQPQENARADASGRFRLEDVQPGMVHVMGRHPEFGENEGIELDLDPGQVKEGVRLTLSRGGRIEGIVDASAGVIADRRVVLHGRPRILGWRETRSDEVGRFAFEGVLPQDYVLQLERADRSSGGAPSPGGEIFLRLPVSVRDKETTRVEFRVEHPRTIAVRGIVTHRGRPLAGVRITANQSAAEFTTASRTTRTDGEGRFELALEAPGAHRFVVMSDPKSFATFERTVPDAPEVTESFDVPAGRIVGRVVDGDGTGIARIPVTALRSSEGGVPKGWTLQRATTGSDGSFAFEFLEDGTYVVRAPDGMQYDSFATPIGYGRVVLPNVAVDASVEGAPIELRLLAEAWISGQVVDSKGRGAAGVAIQVRRQDGIPLSPYIETQTDGTGSFLVSSVPAGSYTILATRDDLRAESPKVLVESGRAARTKIVLP